MSIQFLNTSFQNPIILASSPLTETAEHIYQAELHGASGAILKTCCSYRKKLHYDSRKVIFSSDNKSYYAYSSFEREIMTLEEGLELYHKTTTMCSIPIIPSITALTFSPDDWLSSCLAFQTAGAKIIQLDFFYLKNYLEQPNFNQCLCTLLDTLLTSLSCEIMPKVNVDLPADYIFKTFSLCGIKGVSLLDSIRIPVLEPNKPFELPFESTSYFGTWQLPLSLHYTYIAKQYGLEICGGGGIDTQLDANKMLTCGASLIQVASTILLHGYKKIEELKTIQRLAPENHQQDKQVIAYQIQKNVCICCNTCTESNVWCNAISLDEDGFPFISNKLCEKCGWCAARCPVHAISTLY